MKNYLKYVHSVLILAILPLQGGFWGDYCTRTSSMMSALPACLKNRRLWYGVSVAATLTGGAIFAYQMYFQKTRNQNRCLQHNASGHPQAKSLVTASQSNLSLKSIDDVEDLGLLNGIKYASRSRAQANDWKKQGAVELILYQDKTPVGCFRYTPRTSEQVNINGMAIDPDHQRKGYGAWLMRYMINDLIEKQRYSTIDLMQAADAEGHVDEFYKSLGFVEIEPSIDNSYCTHIYHSPGKFKVNT